MTVSAVILSAWLVGLLGRSRDANHKLSCGVVGSVKDGFQFPLYVECGLLRRLG